MTYGYPPPAGLVTGEAVELELRPARLASRTLAFILDLLVQSVLFFGLLVAYAVIGINLDTDLSATFGLLLLLFCALGVPILLETLWHGRTLGKAAVGLRVVRDDGGPAPFTSIVIRELVGLVLEKPGISLGIVGMTTMVSSERAKRLGDMLAGTLVVTERIPGHESVPVEMPPPLAAWASTLDLSRVPDSLGLSIRQFLGRSGQLDPMARERVGGQLVAAIALVTSPPPPPGTPGWAYLTAIIAERRRRETLSGQRAAARLQPPTGHPLPYAPPAHAVAQPPPPPTTDPNGFSLPT